MDTGTCVILSCLQAYHNFSVSLEDLYQGKVVTTTADVYTWVDGVCRKIKRHIEYNMGLFPIGTYPDDIWIHQHTMYGMGSELVHNGCVIFGNLLLTITIREHDLYKLDSICFPHDLHATMIVSIHDYFNGLYFCLPHPSGDESKYIMVEYDGGKASHIEKGQGLRGQGNIYIHFKLVMPKISQMTKEERKEILTKLISNM